MTNLIIKNLCFKYPSSEKEIFNNFHLSLYQGENLKLVADNGTGKTTLGKLICGLLIPTSGSITIGRMSISSISSKSRIGRAYYIFQENRLQYLKNSIANEIKFIKKISNTHDKQLEFYDSFYLPADKSTNPLDLTINEIWRFSLFLSTIINPQVLFIDEVPSITNNRNMQSLQFLLSKRKNENLITIFSYQRQIDIKFNYILSM